MDDHERGTTRRRVLITGASSGVGRAAVDAFVADGADVALLARSTGGLQAAATAARAAGAEAVVVSADVTDRTAVGRAVARAERRLGGLDVLVLCAAAVAFGPFEEVPPEDFDRSVAVTFVGAVNCVRAALPALERTGGVIVSTGSINSQAPLPTFSSYAASKHALRGFLRTLRVELQARGSEVSVTQVHPGVLDTPLWEHSTSATGRQPRRPPLAYDPAVVAAELVARSHDPRPEVTVGAEAWLERELLSGGNPVSDLALRALYELYASSSRPAATAGALWDAAGRGLAGGSAVVARGSLTAPLRRLLGSRPDRPVRSGS